MSGYELKRIVGHEMETIGEIWNEVGDSVLLDGARLLAANILFGFDRAFQTTGEAEEFVKESIARGRARSVTT